MSQLSVDELLAQATCAVLIEGQAVGTAWLASQEGHLLTAGHVLCKDINACDEVYDEVEIQFSDDEPRIARKIKWRFQQEKGIDFAILKLTDLPPNRQPLPISLTQSVEQNSKLKLRGYGTTFSGPTIGEAKFKGQVDRQGSSSNRLFRYHTQELAEEGFSGGAVYSEQLGAVVGIQIEAVRARFGNMSGMVLAMPLYRIAEYWSALLSQAQKSLTDKAMVSSDVYQPVIDQIVNDSKNAITQHIRIREFRSLVNERAKGFVGRQFIFDTIDDLLQEPDFPSGYILIRGEPGIGKTSLMAELVKQRGYVHHFNIALQNIRSTKDFLGNVCAQLIARYNLPYSRLPPAATQDSGFLLYLLEELSQRAKDDPIVILVDALDEAEDAGLPAAANRLYLPATVPEGVYFVVTSREQYDYRLYVDHRRDIYLGDNDPRNDEDVRVYVHHFVQQHTQQMSAKIKLWRVSIQKFVEILAGRSEGNFMYLVHVLNDIRRGKIQPENIDNIRSLPKGLRAYYQRHWRIMKEQDRRLFEEYYEPVLCFLATVREPVSVGQLQEWTKIKPIYIGEVIEEWREFLNEVEKDERELLYSCPEKFFPSGWRQLINHDLSALFTF